jgi:hypothetical protein
MSTILLIIGYETPEFPGGTEDPASALALSALAASWAVSNDHLVLALGDAPALLAVGTAVLGLQDSRVLEDGNRRESPIRVLSLLASENPNRDRSLGFRRRDRRVTDEREEQSQEEQTFGGLSLLVDMGIMDIVGESPLILEPVGPDIAAKKLKDQIYSERPSAILAIGSVPNTLREVISSYHKEMRYPFACILDNTEGAERLRGAEQVPRLNGRILRFREKESPDEEMNDAVYETSDPELMRAASEATREAELTFRIYQWLTEIPETK